MSKSMTTPMLPLKIFCLSLNGDEDARRRYIPLILTPLQYWERCEKRHTCKLAVLPPPAVSHNIKHAEHDKASLVEIADVFPDLT